MKCQYCDMNQPNKYMLYCPYCWRRLKRENKTDTPKN